MSTPAKNESSEPSLRTKIGVWTMGGVFLALKGYTIYESRNRNPPRPAVQTSKQVDPPNSASASGGSPLRPEDTQPTARPPAAQAARLNILATDGTGELQALFLQAQPSEAQRAALGVSNLAAGSDLYATRVRIENTGTIPVRIYPRNIRMHHGNQAVAAYTIEHPAFLQITVLEPNHFITGLVVYRATLDVGTAIRLRGEGSYSYEDPSVLVTYGGESR